jgi:hypothetical protein
MRSTYSLLNGAEFLELLTESILIGVPRKAARDTLLAVDEAEIGKRSQRCERNLPNE